MDKFWQLFPRKKTPKELQIIIDKDPILKKLQDDFADLNDRGSGYLQKVKTENPETYKMLQRMKLAP